MDDEPRILQGLKRMLFPQRREWKMSFAPSGEAALAELSKGDIDVIVSDMRMPGMDGAALLAAAQREFPHIVRIVLSGHTELEAALRAVPVAHQFLTKPCDPNKLKETVDRSCRLHNVIKNETLRSAIGKMEALPSIPSVYAELNTVLADLNLGLAEIAKVLEKDVAMCAKLLQLVNSAFFGLPRSISDVRTAASLLGINMLRNLVLSVDVFRCFEDRVQHPGFSLESLQQHSILAGHIARHLVADKKQREDAFMAGLLHDVGKLVIASCYPDGFALVLEAMEERRMPDIDAEQQLLGVTHSDVGGYLLGLWGLPYTVIEAVSYHHKPQQVEQQSFDVLSAVYVANVVAKEVAEASGANAPGSADTELDMDYLTKLGVADELPAWRQWAAEQARSGACSAT